MNDTVDISGLVERGTALLRDYLRAERQDHRTQILRDIAPIVVDLRSRFHLEDGRQDWSGRSPDYRRAMSQMYAAAQMPKERQDTFQAALRYHTGNLLRERAGDDELAAVGLTSVSPKERLNRNREALSAQREVAAPRQDAARLTAYASTLLDYVDEAALGLLPPERIVATRIALERLQARSAQLLVRLADAASGRDAGKHRRSVRGV